MLLPSRLFHPTSSSHILHTVDYLFNARAFIKMWVLGGANYKVCVNWDITN